MSETRRRNRLLLGVVAGCLVLGVVVWSGGCAKVTGETAEERRASVIKLADDKPWGYVGALKDAAENDPDALVRQAAVVSLQGIRDDGVRDILFAAAEDDDAAVRRGACRSLMNYPDRETVEKLTEIALGDPDEDVRDMAFTALAANKSPYATTTLVDLMEHGDDEQLRIDAAVAMLDKVNSSAPTDPSDKKAWREMLAGLKASSDVRDAYEDTRTPLVRDLATEAVIIQEHIAHSKPPPGGLESLRGQPSREE